MRNTSYYLLNVHELSPSYDNSVTFDNKASQLQWFMSRKMYQFDDVQYMRKTRNIIIVPLNIAQLDLCNYCIINNGGRPYFYFILEREYLSENSVAISLKLDVIQTYLFDITYGKYDSLIDRSHLNRYYGEGQPITTNLIVPEDLEIGEYVEVNRTVLYDYTNKGGYVVTSADKITEDSPSSGSSGGTLTSKYVSANGFLFIKSTEAFSPNPYNIGDGTNTIGYGVTEAYQPTYYNQLLPSCTEQQASEVMGIVVDNFSNSVYSAMEELGKVMSTVTQNEFDAFVSLAYNMGVGGMKGTQIFIDYCNNVSRETIYNNWLTTAINQGTQFEEGLRDRRKREADIFKNNIYNCKLPISILGGGTVTDNGGRGYIPTKYK